MAALIQQIANAESIDELRTISKNFHEQPDDIRLMDSSSLVNFRIPTDREDTYANHWLPVFGLPIRDPFPVATTGDGNCFLYAASRLLFGDEQHADELRARMVMEAFRDPDAYVDHNNLALGFVSFVPTRLGRTLDEIYAVLSEAHSELPKELRQYPIKVFEHAMFKYRKPYAWSGTWAVHLLANVIRRPVLSLYGEVINAEEGFVQQRDAMNRLIYPFDRQHHWRAYGAIAWVSTGNTASPNHFVAVVP